MTATTHSSKEIMNKMLFASLCATLILGAGCTRKPDPELLVSPEPAPAQVVDAAGIPVEAPVPEEQKKDLIVRNKVTVTPTASNCWVKIDTMVINMKRVDLMTARHAIDEYGIYMASPQLENSGTRIFIPTDKPEEIIDAVLVATKDCN
jgi:hypothetical protein